VRPNTCWSDRSDAVLTLTMNRADKKECPDPRECTGVMPRPSTRRTRGWTGLSAVIIQGSESCFTSGNERSDLSMCRRPGPNSPVYDFSQGHSATQASRLIAGGQHAPLVAWPPPCCCTAIWGLRG